MGRVLTIESSCDETGAAIVEDGRRLIANAVASQIPVHRKYGGVVPELASRNHIRDLHPAVREVLDDAGLGVSEIDGLGVTAGPGLVGSLIVGIEAAKGIAYAMKLPCVGLNHLEAHLTTPLLDLEDQKSPDFPYLGLIASGGHSDLYIVHGFGDYELLGRTRDDAAGEAFDKVAKMLGLSYPGGIVIDELAEQGDPEAIDFPRPMIHHDNFDFSFAGLKTAVRNELKDLNSIPEGDELEDFCASFQQAVVDVLIEKTFAAASERDIDRIVLSGGVACNSALRRDARKRAGEQNRELFIAPPELCTDNAAMLGPIADYYLSNRDRDGPGFYDLRARVNLPV